MSVRSMISWRRHDFRRRHGSDVGAEKLERRHTRPGHHLPAAPVARRWWVLGMTLHVRSVRGHRPCMSGATASSSATRIFRNRDCFSLEKQQQALQNRAWFTPGMADEIDHDLQLLSFGSLGGGEPRGGDYTGIKALMLAVLEDGIRSCGGSPGSVRTEAQDWVRSNQRPPFSFVVICETLGIDPGAARRALARSQTESPPRRLRGNVRRNRPIGDP